MSSAVICPTCGSVASDATVATCVFCGTALDADAAPTRIEQPAADPLLGVKLGDYRVHSRIGIGGMGIVYRAVHPLMGDVAIKVLRPDVLDDLQRFLGEAKAINRVRHPNVVSIFGAGDSPDGRKYLVMELLAGHTLERELQVKGRLPTGAVVPILEEVLAALSAVHAAGVVHRDLKPGNVFLARQGDGHQYVKLLDFGLARRSDQTQVSRVAGTPDYISPEHARGRPPGPPADLYAFGVMAFQLLTGQLPYTGTNPVEVMEQHVSAPRPRADAIDPMIPHAMTALILRLMEKEPDRRPTAAQVKLELDAAAVELRSATTQVAHYGPVPAVISASGSRDTEPQLQAQQSPSAETPLSLSPTSVSPGRSPPSASDTARELPRRRLRVLAAVAGLGLIAALSAKVLLETREPEVSAKVEGRKAAPDLPELEPEASAEGPTEAAPPTPDVDIAVTAEAPTVEPSTAEPEPRAPKRTRLRDWRADTKVRLERAQKAARDRHLDMSEATARALLDKLDAVQRSEQRDFDQRVTKLEATIAGAR